MKPMLFDRLSHKRTKALATHIPNQRTHISEKYQKNASCKLHQLCYTSVNLLVTRYCPPSLKNARNTFVLLARIAECCRKLVSPPRNTLRVPPVWEKCLKNYVS